MTLLLTAESMENDEYDAIDLKPEEVAIIVRTLKAARDRVMPWEAKVIDRVTDLLEVE